MVLSTRSVVVTVSHNHSICSRSTLTSSPALLIYYDGLRIPQQALIDHLTRLETELGDLSRAKVPSRLFKLPILFGSPRETAAIKRYMETQRPYASYLPDNMDFVAKNNGLEKQDLKNILLNQRLIAVSVGFFAALPLCLPVDPRQRICCPKVCGSIRSTMSNHQKNSPKTAG